MKMVGQRVVDGLDGRVGQQGLVGTMGRRNAQCLCGRLGADWIPRRDRGDLKIVTLEHAGNDLLGPDTCSRQYAPTDFFHDV